MADGASPEAVDEVMIDADAPASGTMVPAHDAGASVAAGQAAGNVHLAAGDAETMEHAAASREAADRQARLIAQVEERRRLRATVVPTAVPEVKQLLRQLEQPITLFGEREMERRERLRKLLADMEEEKVLEAMDALEPADQQQQQFVPSTTFYTEGTQALHDARVNLARFSLMRAAERIAAVKRQRADPDNSLEAEEQAAEEGARAVVMQSSEIGDERPVVACAFAPDGSTLATASWSGRLKLWRTHRSEKLLTVQAHDTRITGLAWHPHAQPGGTRQGVSLATGAADSTTRLWSDTGALLQTLGGHTDRLGRIAFHPMGHHLGTASYDLTWRLWDIATGDCLLEQEGHSRAVYTVNFHPDGSLAASGGIDAIGRVWDLRTGRSIMTLEGHVKAILALDFSPNGYQCASGSEDHSVRVWDLRKRGALYMIPAHQSLVSQVRYEPIDGGYLLSTGYDNICRIWSATTFQRITTLTGHEGRVMGGDIAADGSHTIASVAYDKTIKIWAPDEVLPDDPSEHAP